jgi:nucleoredoxin
MPLLQKLLGAKLTSRRGDAPTDDVLENKTTVGLYFTASTCRPCQVFTPVLATVYRNMSLNAYKHLSMKHDMEVVLISMDKDEFAYRDMLLQTPFWALPFARREAAKDLWKRYDVKKIPTLIFVNEHGDAVERNGRHLVENHYTDLGKIWDELQRQRAVAEEMP